MPSIRVSSILANLYLCLFEKLQLASSTSLCINVKTWFAIQKQFELAFFSIQVPTYHCLLMVQPNYEALGVE